MGPFIGCAGWSVPPQFGDQFPKAGSHLERYASRFNCVEINSSFYRPHLPKTYARWRDMTPSGFRFAVKVPRQITHERRLAGTEDALELFLQGTAGLDEKLGALLIQLPPSLAFDLSIARNFFSMLRRHGDMPVVCEPRHASWFETGAAALLDEFRVSRAAADPACVPAASLPGGFGPLAYWRLHGSPEVYYSAYGTRQLMELSQRLTRALQSGTEVWCIFDNTASGHATDNALSLARMHEA